MAAGDLTDLATAYVACNISGTPQPATDAILGTLITAISAYVPQVLNREILSASYTEIYTGTGKPQLKLRQRPVTQISSIAWEGSDALTAGDPILGTSGFWTDGRNACLVNAGCFPLGLPIQITYTAGYTTTPADISWSVAELVAEAYQRRTHVGESTRSANGQVTQSFDAKAMHNAIADRLKNYMAVSPC